MHFSVEISFFKYIYCEYIYLFWLEVYTIWSHKPASNDATLELCGVVPKNRKIVTSDPLPHPSNHDLTKEAAFAMMEVFPCPANCTARDSFHFIYFWLFADSSSAKLNWVEFQISWDIRLIFYNGPSDEPTKHKTLRRVVSSRLLLELDCFCLANIVAEDILRHKMLLPRTFSATSKLLPSTFSATSKLLPSTFAATNKFNLLPWKYSATTCLLPRKFYVTTFYVRVCPRQQ